MKGVLKGLAALAAVSVLATSAAQAQTGVEFSLGGGLTLPLSDFGDAFKTGFNGQVGVGFAPANLPIGFEVDGHFIRNKVDTDGVDVKSQVIGGTANVVYKFKVAETSRIRPYLIAGGGIYNLDAKGDDVPATAESQTKFGINGGAGFNFKAGQSGLGLFVEGRFHNVFSDPNNTNLVNVNVGVRFGR